jgi:hypothetical protein
MLVTLVWQVGMSLWKEHTEAIFRHLYTEDGGNIFIRNVGTHFHQNTNLSSES